MSSGSVAYSRWVQAQCRHSLNLQRGQHAGAGLGTGPNDPAGGEHDAVRCWLGLGSNDPLRCGLNSAHPTLAMRNLLKFAKIPQGMHYAALLLHSSASPRSTLQTPCRLPSCGLVPRLGGLGHQNFLQVFIAFSGRLHSQPAALKAA